MPDAGRHDRPPVRHGRTVGRPPLLGALVTAVYRFEFEPTEEGGAGRLAGTVEGALLQECSPKSACVDFSVLSAGTNPAPSRATGSRCSTRRVRPSRRPTS